MLKRLRDLETTFSIRKASTIIALLTILSRFTGFIRDRLMANQFGAGEITDVYNAAFRIPDLIFNILIIGTLSAAFVPILSGLLHSDPKKAQKVAASIFNAVAITMGVICILYLILAEPLTKLIVPGFSPKLLTQTMNLSRVIIVSQFIFALSNVATNALVSTKRFLIANFAPAVYNLGIIFGIVFLFPRYHLFGLAYGVVIGAVLHFCIQIPELLKRGFSWKPLLMLRDSHVRKIGHLFWPRLFAIDISYATLIIATIIGSTLAAGSISVFIYANNLQSVPIGIFALSTAIAAFPALSEKASSRDFSGYVSLLSRSVAQILFFIIPLSVLFLLFRAQIVRVALGSGAFNWEDTRLTFNCLGAFTFSLFSQSLIPLFSRAFYSLHNTKTPVVITLMSVVVNAILSYFLAGRFGIIGVVYGFSMASIFNCMLSFLLLRANIIREAGSKTIVHTFDHEFFRNGTKIILASIGLGVVAYGALYLVAPFLNTQTAIGLLIQVGISGSLAGVVYLLLAKALKLREAEDLVRWVRRLIFFWQ